MTVDLDVSAGGQRRSVSLRLYIAGGTPTSARAERNLRKAISEADGDESGLNLKIIDVFTDSKRAMADGVIVTPTLIGSGTAERAVMIGDLSDAPKLSQLIRTLLQRS